MIAMALRKGRRNRCCLILGDRQQRAFVLVVVPDQFVISPAGEGFSFTLALQTNMTVDMQG